MSKKDNKVPSEDRTEIGGFTAAEYNAVAMSARLRAINLLNSHYDFSPASGAPVSDWKFGYGVKVNSCKYDEEKGWVAAVIRYSMSAKHGRKKIINCHADFGVFYSVGEVSNAEAAEGFCNNVGTFAAYPYFRALVANLVWNSGLDIPPMPAIASTAHIPRASKEVA